MNRLQTVFPLIVVMMLAVSLSQIGCTLLGLSKKPSVFGTWNYSMMDPSVGTLTGVMVLEEQEDGSYTGRISVVESGIDDALIVDLLEIDGPAFTLQGSVAGSQFIFSGTVDGDMMTGTNEVIGLGTFAVNATRIATEP